MNTAVSPASDLNRAFKRLEFSRAMLRSVFLMSAGETVKDNPELNPLCGKIMGMDRIVRELNFPLWLHSQLGLPSDVSFPYDELIQTITSQAEETKAIIATLMLAVTEAQTQPDQNDWAPSPNEVKQTSLPPGMGNSAVRSAIERLRAALPD